MPSCDSKIFCEGVTKKIQRNGWCWTYRSNDVRNVRNGGAGSSTEVENLAAGSDVNVVDTGEDGSAEFRTERVPHAVLDLLSLHVLTFRSEG